MKVQCLHFTSVISSFTSAFLLQRGHFASSIVVIIWLISIVNKQCLYNGVIFYGSYSYAGNVVSFSLWSSTYLHHANMTLLCYPMRSNTKKNKSHEKFFWQHYLFSALPYIHWHQDPCMNFSKFKALYSHDKGTNKIRLPPPPVFVYVWLSMWLSI